MENMINKLMRNINGLELKKKNKIKAMKLKIQLK